MRKPSEGGTPIDTGFARANWIPRIGERVTRPSGERPTRPGAKFTDTSAQQQGVFEVRGGYRIDLGPIYVSNPVPYIAQLNAGSSRQAPPGFVEASIVKAIVEDIRR